MQRSGRVQVEVNELRQIVRLEISPVTLEFVLKASVLLVNRLDLEGNGVKCVCTLYGTFFLEIESPST